MSSKSSFALKRMRKSRSITQRLRNRQHYGDKIRSITEVPREILTSTEDDESPKEKKVISGWFIIELSRNLLTNFLHEF